MYVAVICVHHYYMVSCIQVNNCNLQNYEVYIPKTLCKNIVILVLLQYFYCIVSAALIFNIAQHYLRVLTTYLLTEPYCTVCNSVFILFYKIVSPLYNIVHCMQSCDNLEFLYACIKYH